MEPQHGRRRGIALLVSGAAAVIVLAVIGKSGSGTTVTPHRVARTPSAYSSHIQTLGSSAASALGAAERSAEDEAIDRTLSYTPYVRVAGSQHREIALTFDDGPSAFTPRVLSILGSKGAGGTFFEVGLLEPYFHSFTTRIAAAGFAVGDHTESHAPMSHLSAELQRTQVLEEASLIKHYGSAFPRLFRPPYGLWNSTTLLLLRRFRMLMVLWTVDTADYQRPGTKTIVRRALAGARPGAIILMHDGGGDRSQTVAALPRIISALHARGYQLVTIPRLLLDNPAPANQRVSAIAGSGG